MHIDIAHWQTRLDTLRAAHQVPGAALGLVVDDQVHELASGVLHSGTGVAVTTDSVFLSGSLAKAYTATAIMRLADTGAFGLDTPITAILPDFHTPDPASAKITVRQLLSHTSGLTCDFNHDTGRGDDCVARYVTAAESVAPDCPPGIALSYSSVGYAVLGRVMEVVTGTTWDRALHDLVFAPLGLARSVTLPEEALRFRVAMGHFGTEPAPTWDMMPRSAGPYGRIITSAGDVARFAGMHLNDGLAADGTRVLSVASAVAMRTREAGSPDKWTMHADGWGAGWTLYDWAGVPGYGHDGSAVTQQSFLRIVPHAGLAVALMVNGGHADRLYADLFGELLGELADVRMPAPFAVPEHPPEVNTARYLGTYRREGVRTTILRGDTGRPRLRYELVDGMAGYADPLEAELVPLSDTVFAASGEAFGLDALPVVFAELPDGKPYVYVGMRATPKID
ncbi:penicillin-binding protein [Amycolatopsis antarctica]|uniref:Penicillin-binding protein n=1 Tax=Amycolatopsis antarctica TaxID=1854586 RepID=A0A263D301_9PSEU|nr:serine hydrolase domain-containing protein [Amycolatopsis antarctica]OZM71846.1 penicillin-binding protein [Amycolatopsis antarctica]